METKIYSFAEMAKELNCTKETVRKRLKRNNIKWFKRIKSTLYFTQKDFNSIKEDDTIILYKPVYITETYHIYQSKMNYE